MIGLLIGLIISGTMLSTWLNMQTSALTALQQSRLHQDLRAINYIMVRDIRRAGYWGWTPDSGIAVTENPFMTTANNINIDRADNNETDASCLTYSYDLDHDGLVGATSVEQFGFRLHDQAIEMRTGGTTFSCRDGLWQDITQTGTIITSLRFSMHNEIIAPTTGCNPGQTCIRRRLVNISLTGHLQSRPDQSITLEEQISIRNDHLSLSV
jgi:type II secretory pathway component PulJ